MASSRYYGFFLHPEFSEADDPGVFRDKNVQSADQAKEVKVLADTDSAPKNAAPTKIANPVRQNVDEIYVKYSKLFNSDTDNNAGPSETSEFACDNQITTDDEFLLKDNNFVLDIDDEPAVNPEVPENTNDADKNLAVAKTGEADMQSINLDVPNQDDQPANMDSTTNDGGLFADGDVVDIVIPQQRNNDLNNCDTGNRTACFFCVGMLIVVISFGLIIYFKIGSKMQ